ncbi:MAG: MoxR family ATPase [bacterium]|nr:MoxR family ATPase [bacterium]
MMNYENAENTFEYIRSKMMEVEAELKKTIIGIDGVLHLITIALFSRGHVLLEGVPGVGKTALCRCLSKAVKGGFARIQGVPDLLPRDAVIIEDIDAETGRYVFKPGPLISQGEKLAIVLLDEINRIHPKGQAGFLEVMQERTITAFGQQYKLPHVIFVATRNSVEKGETEELPHAQRDRFLMEIDVPYLSAEYEKELMRNPKFEDMGRLIEGVAPIIETEEITEFWDWIGKNISVSPAILDYIYNIVDASRHPSSYGINLGGADENDKDIIMAGISPRGEIMIRRASQTAAVLRGSKSVLPQDLHEILVPTMAHRIFFQPSALRRRSKIAEEFLLQIKNKVAPYER